jgi:outer membrane protein OmpA-like peptidoglycan-associated protein
VKWRLNEKFSLYTGLFFDYGFNNIYKENSGFLTKDQRIRTRFFEFDPMKAEMTSNSILTSRYTHNGGNEQNFTNKISPIAFGVKVRLAINLCRGERPIQNFETVVRRNDTIEQSNRTVIIKNDTIVEQHTVVVQKIDTIVQQHTVVIQKVDTVVQQHHTVVQRNDTVVQQQTVIRNQPVNPPVQQPQTTNPTAQDSRPITTSATPTRLTFIKPPENIEITVEEGYTINNIYYDYNSADILSQGSRELDLLIDIALKNPHLKFEMTAHTDERGTHVYNQELSERRLKAAIDYVQRRGLNPSRIIARAAGKAEPLYRNAKNEEEHALNRRTTIRMYDPSVTQAPQRLDFEVVERSPLNTKGLVFRVQIAAYKEIPKHPTYYFRDHLNAAPGLHLTYYRDTDGMYKFSIGGDLTSLEQAKLINQRIQSIGKQSFVKAYLDGKAITIAEAEAILRRR